MLVVGITGVMGSGKSTVSKILNTMGVEVYDCDMRAKGLMLEGGVRRELKGVLGEGAYMEDGGINREWIAKRIFSDRGLKNRVEGVVHGALKGDLERWITKHKEEKYVVVESAILYGSAVEELVDIVVVVSANIEEIFQRVAKRDGLSKEQIEQRLTNQLTQKELQQRAQYTLKTSYVELLIPKVVVLNDFLLSLPTNIIQK